MLTQEGSIHPTVIICPGAVVDPTARVRQDVYIGYGANVGEYACIYDGTTVSDRAEVGAYTTVREDSLIERDVIIGSDVKLGKEALIMADAKICLDTVTTKSSNARELLGGVSIGPGVILHNEVELGFHAIVPSQRAIAHVGGFGKKNRVVTVYGSDNGPRYSVGCQLGIDWPTFQRRVVGSEATQSSSAETYLPFFGAFTAMGAAVQKAYEKETVLVDEIKDRRQAEGMTLVFNYDDED